MNLPSAPSSATASAFTPILSRVSVPLRCLEEDRITAKKTRYPHLSCSLKSLFVSSGIPSPVKRRRLDFLFRPDSSSRRRLFLACASGSTNSSGNHNLSTEIASSTGRGAKNIVIKRFSDEDASTRLGTSGGGNFASSFREDPIVDKLRTQLGVIHPLPSPPPISGNVAGLFVIFFFFGVLFDKVWTRVKRAKRRPPFMWPQLPTNSISTLLEKDLQRKESVEWVNMVLGKLWKVYRSGIENWIMGLLQPVIDDLEKPDYVQRVEIKQFSLGDAPLSVRSVERKTSRRANDLQYQIGIRYTGDARMLLMLSLKFGIIPIVVPVGVRDFDIDGVLWVKLQLIPTEPWVGAVQWAFVSLPKIKFELSPFRLFNLMAIPVVSMFLTKLLTEDLPRLFVRPKKIVLDFQKGKAVGPVADDLKSGATDDLKSSAAINEKNNDYSGELSVTLVDACNLSYMFYGKTDPYVIINLGDQSIRSKKNSQTTVIGPPGEPIWNQDFHLLVTNPRKQKLSVEVRDSVGFTEVTIGTAEVDLSILEDTVPTDRILVLKGGWGLFTKGNCGELLLRLTYRAYVEDEEDDWRQRASAYSDVSEDEVSDSDEVDSVTTESMQGDFLRGESGTESFMDVLAALIVSEEFQGIVASETGSDKTNSSSTIPSTRVRATESPPSKSENSKEDSNGSSVLLWLAVITSAAVLIAINISGSSIFNP